MQQMSIKIDEQADLKLRDSQISQNLSFKHRIDSLHAFQFYYNVVFNYQIYPVFPNEFSAILNWKGDLTFEGYPSELQFHSKSRLVNGFQKPWPELTVNFNGAAYGSPQLDHHHP